MGCGTMRPHGGARDLLSKHAHTPGPLALLLLPYTYIVLPSLSQTQWAERDREVAFFVFVLLLWYLSIFQGPNNVHEVYSERAAQG